MNTLVDDLRVTADKAERARYAYGIAGRLRRAAAELDRLDAKIRELQIALENERRN